MLPAVTKCNGQSLPERLWCYQLLPNVTVSHCQKDWGVTSCCQMHRSVSHCYQKGWGVTSYQMQRSVTAIIKAGMLLYQLLPVATIRRRHHKGWGVTSCYQKQRSVTAIIKAGLLPAVTKCSGQSSSPEWLGFYQLLPNATVSGCHQKDRDNNNMLYLSHWEIKAVVR